MFVRDYEDKDFSSLNNLLIDVYGVRKEKCDTNNIELVSIYNDIVIGYLTLTIIHDSVKNINWGMVNYVCVDKNYRKKGVATNLFKKVLKICEDKKISYIELTSNEKRVEAHALYKKLGFNIRNTTVFRKELL